MEHAIHAWGLADDLAVAAVELTSPPSIVATMRKPSYLSSNIPSLSSSGPSMSLNVQAVLGLLGP
jgi:hypothetical protein